MKMSLFYSLKLKLYFSLKRKIPEIFLSFKLFQTTSTAYGVWMLYVLILPSSSNVVVAALYPEVLPLIICCSLSAVER